MSVPIKQRRESQSTHHDGEAELELKLMPCLSLMSSQQTAETLHSTNKGR